MADSADRSWKQPDDKPPVNWPALILGGLLLAVAVGVAVFVALGPDDDTAAPDEEVPLPTLAPSTSDAESADPTPTGDQSSPAASDTPAASASVDPTRLDQASFQRVNGVRVPVHPDAGPSVQQDGLARGFERSPLGAVMAAFNISARSSPEVGPAVFRPTLAEQHVGDAADLEAELARVERAYERQRVEQGIADGQPLNEPLFQYLGWSLDFYDGDNAEVRLLAQGPGGDGAVLEATFRTPLRWENGDWRYVAPPDGDLNPWVVTTFDESRFTMLDQVG